MFVLAHLSDLHMSLRPRLLELAGKRGLGYINWHRGRKYIHRRETLDAITRDLKTVGTPEHNAISATPSRRRTNGKVPLGAPSSPRM